MQWRSNNPRQNSALSVEVFENNGGGGRALTITPLPKYLAVSNALFGTRAPSHFVRRARTGKRAPNREPRRMTKIESTRSNRCASDPPFTVSFPPLPLSGGGGGVGEELVMFDIVFSSFLCVFFLLFVAVGRKLEILRVESARMSDVTMTIDI